MKDKEQNIRNLNFDDFLDPTDESEIAKLLIWLPTLILQQKIYSRIGRICKNDVGSSSVFSNHWFLSYYKARFFCTSYQAGQQPFDHDELGKC